MNRMWRRLSASTAAVSLVLGLTAGWLGAQARVTKRGTWTELFRVEEVAGTELVRPQSIRISRRTIGVYDQGSRELLAIDLRGRFLWRQGRQGSGPGEYGNVTDLSEDGRGGFLVLDASNSRITQVSGEGKLTGTIPLKSPSHRISAAGTRIVVQPLSSQFAEILSARGDLVRSAGVPPELTKVESPLVREGRLLPAPQNETVVVHRWSTAVIVLDSLGSVRRRFDLLNRQDFPSLKSYKSGQRGEYVITKIDPNAREILGCGTVDGDRLLIVDQRADTTKALLDEYDLSTGRYLGTSQLPAYPVALASTAGLLIALVEEPVPSIVAWRWRDR